MLLSTIIFLPISGGGRDPALQALINVPNARRVDVDQDRKPQLSRKQALHSILRKTYQYQQGTQPTNLLNASAVLDFDKNLPTSANVTPHGTNRAIKIQRTTNPSPHPFTYPWSHPFEGSAAEAATHPPAPAGAAGCVGSSCKYCCEQRIRTPKIFSTEVP